MVAMISPTVCSPSHKACRILRRIGSANTLKRSAIICRAASESCFFGLGIPAPLTFIHYIAN